MKSLKLLSHHETLNDFGLLGEEEERNLSAPFHGVKGAEKKETFQVCLRAIDENLSEKLSRDECREEKPQQGRRKIQISRFPLVPGVFQFEICWSFPQLHNDGDANSSGLGCSSTRGKLFSFLSPSDRTFSSVWKALTGMNETCRVSREL